MQPEVKDKQKKEPTPMEQWDILAAKVISRELAPKGFKKLTSGSYRGLEIANHSTPGITKDTVRKCQSIGVGLVRGYRERAKTHLDKVKEFHVTVKNNMEKELLNTPFYRFKRRNYLSKGMKGEIVWIMAIEEAIDKLNLTPIQ